MVLIEYDRTFIRLVFFKVEAFVLKGLNILAPTPESAFLVFVNIIKPLYLGYDVFLYECTLFRPSILRVRRSNLKLEY
jgi:hypothetical protein